jgi:hypothetical protein
MGIGTGLTRLIYRERVAVVMDTERDLGRMSTAELSDPKEISERRHRFWCGAPGREAMLSAAQVREVAPPARVHNSSADSGEQAASEAFDNGWNACREAFARALLNLVPNDPSPLRELKGSGAAVTSRPTPARSIVQ